MNAEWFRPPSRFAGKASPASVADLGIHASEPFQHLMADHGITCSISRSGNVWDNAGMASFSSYLKTMRTMSKVRRTEDGAGAHVFDDVERF